MSEVSLILKEIAPETVVQFGEEWFVNDHMQLRAIDALGEEVVKLRKDNRLLKAMVENLVAARKAAKR